MESLFGSLRQGGHRPPRPLPRLGLHRRRAGTRSRAGCVSIRDRAFAELGDRNLRDLKVEGASPQFTVDKVIEATPAAGAQRLPPRGGHGHRPVLPERGRAARPGRATTSARTASRARSPATPTTRATCATSRAPRAPTSRRARRCTGMACSATPARRGPATSRSSATRTTCSSAPWTGSAWPTRTWANAINVLQTSRNFPTPRRPAPAGLPRLHVRRADDDPPGRASPRTRPSS